MVQVSNKDAGIRTPTFLGDLVERGISARKSDEDISKIDYFPLEDIETETSQRIETTVRQARDCKSIKWIHFSCNTWSSHSGDVAVSIPNSKEFVSEVDRAFLVGQIHYSCHLKSAWLSLLLHGINY